MSLSIIIKVDNQNRSYHLVIIIEGRPSGKKSIAERLDIRKMSVAIIEADLQAVGFVLALNVIKHTISYALVWKRSLAQMMIALSQFFISVTDVLLHRILIGSDYNHQ